MEEGRVEKQKISCGKARFDKSIFILLIILERGFYFMKKILYGFAIWNRR